MLAIKDWTNHRLKQTTTVCSFVVIFSVSDRHLLIAAERERVDPLVRSECFRLTGDVDKTQHPTLSMPLLPFSRVFYVSPPPNEPTKALQHDFLFSLCFLHLFCRLFLASKVSLTTLSLSVSFEGETLYPSVITKDDQRIEWLAAR